MLPDRQTQIYPLDAVSDSAEMYFSHYSRTAASLYFPVILIFLLICISLPWIKIDRNIYGRGMIRPIREKIEIRALHSGIVSELHTGENLPVSKGQILFCLRNPVHEKITVLEAEQLEIGQFIRDLELIVQEEIPPPGIRLTTLLYRKKLSLFYLQLNRLTTGIETAQSALDRAERLFNNELLSKADYEDQSQRLEALKLEKEVFVRDFNIGCRTDHYTKKSRYQDISAALHSLRDQVYTMEIRSPVTGTMEPVLEMSAGIPVYAGQLLARISPDTGYIAALAVSPREIGYLKKGDPAEIEIEGYRKNEWGVIRGNIIDISDDFISDGRNPAFQVKCSLNQTWLGLREGERLPVRKGMTLRARFHKTRYSLMHLVRNEVHDHINAGKIRGT